MIINIMIDELREGEEAAILGITERALRWHGLASAEVRLDMKPSHEGPRDMIAIFKMSDPLFPPFYLGAVYSFDAYSYHS